METFCRIYLKHYFLKNKVCQQKCYKQSDTVFSAQFFSALSVYVLFFGLWSCSFFTNHSHSKCDVTGPKKHVSMGTKFG